MFPAFRFLLKEVDRKGAPRLLQVFPGLEQNPTALHESREPLENKSMNKSQTEVLGNKRQLSNA